MTEQLRPRAAARRSAGPVATPLTPLLQALSSSRSTVVRRSAVLAVGAGALMVAGQPTDQAPAAGVVQADETATPERQVNAAQTALGETDAVAATTVEVSAEKAPEARAPKADAASGDADAAPASSGSGDATEVISIAKKYLGVPYVWGGSSPSGFDCSGFTSYVYNQVGVKLPRTSSAQKGAGTIVSAAEAKPGDLVWHPGHIGIYLGDGKKIHSPQTGDVVKIADLSRTDTTFIRVL